MKAERLQPMFVEEFPALMEPGLVYVSLEYNTCGHTCACGCGNEVMTPLSPAQWSLTYDGRDLSLWPSVGNWALPCRSHYVLQRGRVRWSHPFSDDEVDRSRYRDRRALERRDHHWLDDHTDDGDGLEAGTADKILPDLQIDPAPTWKHRMLGWLPGRG